MKKKFIFALIALCTATCALSMMGACKNEPASSSSVGNESSSTLPLELAEKKIEVILGESKQITALSLDEGETVSYISNDESVVTVTATGVVEGVKVGSAVVKATTSLGRSALVQVTVYDPEFYPIPYISVAQNALTKCVGDTFEIEYTYTYLGESIDGAVEITSADPSIVSVDGKTLTAVGVGETTVQLSGTSSYGTAIRTVSITVSAEEAEFYPSFLGKDIFVGNAMPLTMYVNVNGQLSTIDNATFTSKNTDLIAIENGELVPLDGGDTEIVAAFEYGGKSYSKDIPVHIYGQNTCSFVFADGTVDHTLQAFYGESIALEVENPLQNPEYSKEVKCWYVDGEEVVGDFFVMPDSDVEVSVRFVNETADDFTSQFSDGHLLGDAQAKAKYISEPFVDSKGVSSDLGGYVRFGDNNWASLSFNFDTPVVVNEYASVQLKVYMPADALLLYFGYATSENWSAENPTKRYEASAGVHKSGDVPLCIIPEDEWTIIEMPLSAFVDATGDILNGISISVAKGAIYIDYIIVNEGLAVNDPVYMDNVLCQDVVNAESGSAAQRSAIAAYYQWSKTLTDAERATELHQANVATIKEMFTACGGEIVVESIPSLTTSGLNDLGNRVDDGDALLNYATGKYTYSHRVVFDKESTGYDGTVSLKAFNYNAYGEVYFGLYMIAGATQWEPTYIGENGKLTVYGSSYDGIDPHKAHYYFKVSIKDGVLTVVDDSQNNVAGGGTVLTATLSEEVFNGTEKLELGFNFGAWSQIEITSLCATITVDDII